VLLKAFIERINLYETTPVWHSAAPLKRAGAQSAFSSPIEATNRAVMLTNHLRGDLVPQQCDKRKKSPAAPKRDGDEILLSDS
jgi:hypothetical protein